MVKRPKTIQNEIGSIKKNLFTKNEISSLVKHCYSATKKDPLLLSGKFAIKIERQHTEEKSSLVCTHLTYRKVAYDVTHFAPKSG